MIRRKVEKHEGSIINTKVAKENKILLEENWQNTQKQIIRRKGKTRRKDYEKEAGQTWKKIISRKLEKHIEKMMEGRWKKMKKTLLQKSGKTRRKQC